MKKGVILLLTFVLSALCGGCVYASEYNAGTYSEKNGPYMATVTFDDDYITEISFDFVDSREKADYFDMVAQRIIGAQSLDFYSEDLMDDKVDGLKGAVQKCIDRANGKEEVNNEESNEQDDPAEFICYTLGYGNYCLIFRNNTDYKLHGEMYYTTPKETEYIELPSKDLQIAPHSNWYAMVRTTTDEMKRFSWEYSLTDDNGHDYTGTGTCNTSNYNKEFDFDSVVKQMQMDAEESNPKSEPKVGMTKAEVLESSWGSPRDKTVREYEWGTTEQWVYRNGYIYFEDGIVTSITRD